MHLSLTSPLCVFDIEATGLSITQDRIVEIAIVKIHPDGTQETYTQRVNPGIKIPQETIDIHGITNEDVKDAPGFREILPELEKFIAGTDFAGFNSNKFDLPLLAEELLRAGSEIDLSNHKHIDVQNIFHKMEQRNLIAAYAFYCQKNLNNAHSALADATATWEVLDAQVERYQELTGEVDFLANFSRYGDVTRADFAGRLAYNEEGEVVYNFGKHKGKTILEVSQTEPGYYGWMLDADFPLYTKQRLRKEMDKIKKEKETHKKEDTLREQERFQSKLDALRNKFKS